MTNIKSKGDNKVMEDEDKSCTSGSWSIRFNNKDVD